MKFKQWFIVVGYFGCEYLLDQVQLVGGQTIQVNGIHKNITMYQAAF